jgi:hypothetical protein
MLKIFRHKTQAVSKFVNLLFLFVLCKCSMSKEIDVTLHTTLGLHATGYHQSAHVLVRSLTKAELFELGYKIRVVLGVY